MRRCSTKSSMISCASDSVRMPALEIALKVDIEEGGGAAEAHRRAVLLPDAREVGKVQPLDGFLGIFCRTGDVKAVGSGHFDHIAQRFNLVGKLLSSADFGFRGRDRAERVLVLLLFFDQTIHAVQRNAAVVADDAAAAVGVRQAGQQADVARLAHVLGIGGEHAVVMRLVVFELPPRSGGRPRSRRPCTPRAPCACRRTGCRRALRVRRSAGRR